MNNIIKLISSIMIVATLITTNIFGNEQNIIAGEDRFETAIEISKSWKTSQEAILVNSTATSDLLCATVLSSQIDCPILLTNKTKINEGTNNEIKRLKANKIYIIGGEDVIHETIEKELNKNSINTERIYGQDRYETSIKVANKVNKLKKSNTAILVNGEYSVADAVSISPVAGNKNIPVILCKNKEVNNQIEWMENNNIKNSYIIGGQNVIHETIEDKLNKNNIKTERIYGEDRYETNAKVIEKFYKESKIDKLFYCKGENINNKDEIIDGMLVASLAAKEKAPIILLGENLSESQKVIIKNKDIKNLIQVGYGVSDKAKNELHKLKEGYNTPSYDDSSTSKPSTPELPPISKPNKPSQPEEPPINDNDSSKPENEDIPSQDEEDNDNLEQDSEESNTPKEDLKYMDYTIDDEKKVITINFNKEIYTSKESIEELKEGIRLIIDKNNIHNNVSEEKYIKLNKYENVSIKEQSLIIELEDELIKNSTIVVNSDTIKDRDNKCLKELKVKIEEGLDKKIVFVKNEHELNRYIINKNIDIIKLENNIDIVKQWDITFHHKVIIDGSNGNENFKISRISTY